jgi:formate dehydrogenase iron-sulfur subunit
MGKKPACVGTCPTGALALGERDQLLQEAHQRIESHPERYHSEVYGERTAGGTGVLYLTAVPFEKLGLQDQGFRTDLGDLPHGRAGTQWMSGVPWVALTVGGASIALYHLNQRRAEVEKQEGKEG